MATFKGFNTVNQPFPSFGLVDQELIKRDLLNHFHTRKGERVMQPNFGSLIPDYLFEPLDARTRQLIIEDAISVVSFDPRVQLEEVNLIEVDRGIILEISLFYTTYNDRDILKVAFNRQNQ